MKHGDPNYPFSDLFAAPAQYRLPGLGRLATAALTIALAIAVTIMVMAL